MEGGGGADDTIVGRVIRLRLTKPHTTYRLAAKVRMGELSAASQTMLSFFAQVNLDNLFGRKSFVPVTVKSSTVDPIYMNNNENNQTPI